jgi:pilus assembly protein FimV
VLAVISLCLWSCGAAGRHDPRVRRRAALLDEVVPVVEPAALALVREVATAGVVGLAAGAAPAPPTAAGAAGATAPAAVEPVVVAVAAASGAAAAGAAPVRAIGSGETATQNPPKASAVRPASAQRPGALFRLVGRRARPRCSVPGAGASEAAAGARVGVRAV